MRAFVGMMLIASVSTASAAAETLGRLFFTPAERAQLDHARAQKERPQPKAEAPSAAPPAPQVLTYNGIVRRSDGKSVLWLNNRPVDEKDALSGLAVSGRIRSDGAMTLRAPTGRTIDLKVGQSVELSSGAVAENAPRVAPALPAAPVPAKREAETGAPQPAAQEPFADRRDATAPATAPARTDEAPRPR